MDYTLDNNGRYYGFISNYANGHIIKLDYGNSLLNTPTAQDLGDFKNKIPIYAEVIQVKQDKGNCYVFVVAAGDAAGNGSVLVRIDFGSSFSNGAPTAVHLGNVGQLLFPHDLFITQQNNNFYGFTININNNTITRFDFGNSLNNQPTGVNLGSIGSLNYPCGISFINTSGNWYAFVTNRNSNSISRLSFGTSLTNVLTGSNIGNPGNFLTRPRDVSIFESCNGIVGLVVNEQNQQTGTITKLDFGFNLLSNPKASDLGNLGQLKFPHSISKFFLEGNDIYSFITNVNNNTITRLRYTGCTSTNISSSTQQMPPPVIYKQPGIYNVNLLVDIGLPTQTSFCKQIVVKNCNTVCNLNAGFTYRQNTCNPKIVQFNDTTSNADSIWWNFGDGQTAGNIKNPAVKYNNFRNYTVQLFAKTNAGYLDTATITINVDIKKDSAIINNDTSVCTGTAIQLKAITGLKYCWSPSYGLSDSSMQNPIATIQATTKYYLNILALNNQPVIEDSITINVIPPPVVNAGKDVSVCKGSYVQLNATGANTYIWNASADLSDTSIANPVATPSNSQQFIVKGYNIQGCINRDTVKVSVLPLPVFTLINDTAICKGDSIMLQANSQGNNIYSWNPPTGLSNPNVYNPVASPADTTKYFVAVTDANNCIASDSVQVNVLSKPVVSTLNDTSICNGTTVVLTTTASNVNTFKWFPSAGLNDTGLQSPKASPATSTLYIVSAGNGVCSKNDSVMISTLPLPLVIAGNDTTVCGNASAQLNASGALSYTWSPSTGLSNINISNPNAAPGATTTYFVMGTGINSCTNIDSVQVTINPPPVFNITPINTILCKGDSVLLTASGGDLYNWFPTLDLSNALSSNTEAHPSENTIYKVVITNIVCKVTDSLTSNITVNALPTVTISKSNDIDCINYEVQLNATGGINYQWTPYNYISNTHISNPTVSPRNDTKYFVTVKNGNGCSNKDSILIASTNANADKARFEAITAFTPNQDGLNDCFNVRYWGQADVFDLAVYNRWGQAVFHSNDINKCWDGTFNGMPQAAGTYVYKVNISSNCSKGLIQRKGTVVLIR